jgi:hypothetical protein
MKSQYFDSLMETPNQALYDKVIFAVNKEETKVAKIKIGIFSITSLISVSAFILSFRYLYESMVSSGFIKFVSLAFSDGLSVFKYTGDYLLSIVDSLPSVELILFLFVALISFVSVSYMFSSLKRARFVRRALA